MPKLDPTATAQLRLISVPPDIQDAAVFPDFFIAGPQRTGSSWLHYNLARHPEIFLSDPKELFFFNALKDPDHPQRRSSNLGWYLSFFRETPAYTRMRRTQCRREFGMDYNPRIRGESTASYAAGMDDEMIREVTLLNPDIKIIITLRHPVERMWSHAKKDLGRERRRSVSDIPRSEFESFFSHPYNIRCGMYTQQIDTWQRHLKPGNLFVNIIDQMAKRHLKPGNLFVNVIDQMAKSPRPQLMRVMEFLGVTSNRALARPLHNEKIRNATEATRTIPEPWRTHLSEMYRDEIERLRAIYDVDW